MSNSVTSTPTEENKLQRRTFISAGVIGGMALAWSPTIRATALEVADVDAAAVTPSPADSINMYILLLDRIRGLVLRPYFDLVGCLSAEVKSRYDQLRSDVDELERLVPQLRTRQTSLRGVTDFGQASVALLNSLAEERIVPALPLFAMISFTPETLRDLSTELQTETGSLTLSQRAADLLRKILQEIKDLQKPTDDLDTTSNLLTELNNSLEGTRTTSPTANNPATIGEIRLELIAAMNDLVVDELTGRTTPERQASARSHVEAAVKMLGTWDAYKPPASLLTYLAASPATRCKQGSGTMATEPTKNLRDLLTATATWIGQGGQLSAENQAADVQFVKASFRPNALPGLKATCRSVLSEFLPPATGLRTYILMGLLAPIVCCTSSANQENMIYNQIPNLWPGGSFDNDSKRRHSAARRILGL